MSTHPGDPEYRTDDAPWETGTPADPRSASNEAVRPRVAIVHERFTEYGGSEAVVGELARTWPQARVFAPIVDPAAAPAIAHPPWDTVSGTWLSRAYAATGRRSHAPLLPLVPALCAACRCAAVSTRWWSAITPSRPRLSSPPTHR